MFKADWEKASVTHQLPHGMIERMVRLAYPDKKLILFDMIVGGCANLNIKILLENEKCPLILRIYLRDKEAAYREKNLAVLLKQTVPVPLTYYIGELDGYRFAIIEFMSGISLKNLLLGNVPYNIRTIMYEVGAVLSRITGHQFSQAGFFDKDLNIALPISSDDYLVFARDCLRDEIVLSVLAPKMISDISQVFSKYAPLLPDENEKHLVHADFDPANILVRKTDGDWRVGGILDWEFAFSGSVLCDVANMLRYAHKMQAEFRNSFLDGLRSHGVILPENWPITVNLLNLSALLDCLRRSDPRRQPNQCADIRGLIDHILESLDKINA